MIRSTSLEAYEELKKSGKENTQRGRILLSVIEAGRPVTRLELEGMTKLKINAVTGRVKSLLESGMIRETEDTIRCPISGNRVNGLVPVTAPTNKQMVML